MEEKDHDEYIAKLEGSLDSSCRLAARGRRAKEELGNRWVRRWQRGVIDLPRFLGVEVRNRRIAGHDGVRVVPEVLEPSIPNIAVDIGREDRRRHQQCQTP